MRNEAILNMMKTNLKRREEPEFRRFIGGTMWFCHLPFISLLTFFMKLGRTIALIDKSTNLGSAPKSAFYENQKRSHLHHIIRVDIDDQFGGRR